MHGQPKGFLHALSLDQVFYTSHQQYGHKINSPSSSRRRRGDYNRGNDWNRGNDGRDRYDGRGDGDRRDNWGK